MLTYRIKSQIFSPTLSIKALKRFRSEEQLNTVIMINIAYLEPGVGGSCQEEAGETPDGVRERRPAGEVG